jgi:hypothetical protein
MYMRNGRVYETIDSRIYVYFNLNTFAAGFTVTTAI